MGTSPADLAALRALLELVEGRRRRRPQLLQLGPVVVDGDEAALGDRRSEPGAGADLAAVGGDLVHLGDGGGDPLVPAVALGVRVQVQDQPGLGEGADALPAVVGRDHVGCRGVGQLQLQGLVDVVEGGAGPFHLQLRVLRREGGVDRGHPLRLHRRLVGPGVQGGDGGFGQRPGVGVHVGGCRRLRRRRAARCAARDRDGDGRGREAEEGPAGGHHGVSSSSGRGRGRAGGRTASTVRPRAPGRGSGAGVRCRASTSWPGARRCC